MIKNAFPKLGLKVNGIEKEYYARAGENISPGDFVKFEEGIAYQRIEESPVIDIIENGTVQAVLALENNDLLCVYSVAAETGKDFYAQILTAENHLISIEDSVFLANIDYFSFADIKRVSATQFITCYTDNADKKLYASLITVSGNNITYSEAKLINSDQTRIEGVFVLDSTRCIVVYEDYANNSYAKIVILTVGNGTVSVGTAKTLASSTISYHDILVVNNTTICIIYDLDSIVTATLITISSSAITIRGSCSLENSDYGFSRAILLSEAKILLITKILANRGDLDFYYDHYACILSISSTSISDYALTSVIQTEFSTGVKVAIAKVSATEALYMAGKNAVQLNVSGNTVSVGTQTQIFSGEELIYETYQSDNKIILFHRVSTSSNNIKSKTLTVGDTVGVSSEVSIVAWNGLSGIIPLPNNRIFMRNSKQAVMTKIAEDYTVSRNFLVTTYEQQVKKVTSGQFNGVSKSKIIGGTETEHNQKGFVVIPG